MKSILTQTPDEVGSQQARWDRKRFEDFITDKGYNCYIERALSCPCKSMGNGSALSDCQNCQGTGWFFIDKKLTKIACSSMSNRTKYETWTVTNAGTVNISMRASDKVGMMDKITLIELLSWFSQVLYLQPTLGGLNDPSNAYLFAYTIYNPIEVNNVYLFTSPNTPLTVISSDNYKIIDNKIFVLKTSIGNVANPCISVDYSHNPVYHVIDINRDLIKQRDGSGVSAPLANMPLNCVGRRAHYVLDNPNYGADSVFDNTNYSKVIPPEILKPPLSI